MPSSFQLADSETAQLMQHLPLQNVCMAVSLNAESRLLAHSCLAWVLSEGPYGKQTDRKR